MIIGRLAISSLCMLTAVGSMFIRSTRTLGSESLASSRAQNSQPETSAKRISVTRDKIENELMHLVQVIKLHTLIQWL